MTQPLLLRASTSTMMKCVMLLVGPEIRTLLESGYASWPRASLCYCRIPPPLSRQGTADEVKTFMDPFEGAIQDLLDLSLCFSIAAEISTLAFHRRANTRYEMVVAELLCVFASSACAVLWIFHTESGRFRITRFATLPIGVAIKHGTMIGNIAKDFVRLWIYNVKRYRTSLEPICATD